MTLFEEMQELLREDPFLDTAEVPYDMVSDEFQGSGRWTEHWRAVFQKGDEYVALDYEVPSTEYQEGSEAESSIMEVEPITVEVIKYIKKVDY